MANQCKIIIMLLEYDNVVVMKHTSKFSEKNQTNSKSKEFCGQSRVLFVEHSTPQPYY